MHTAVTNIFVSNFGNSVVLINDMEAGRFVKELIQDISYQYPELIQVWESIKKDNFSQLSPQARELYGKVEGLAKTFNFDLNVPINYFWEIQANLINPNFLRNIIQRILFTATCP